MFSVSKDLAEITFIFSAAVTLAEGTGCQSLKSGVPKELPDFFQHCCFIQPEGHGRSFARKYRVISGFQHISRGFFVIG